MAGANIADYEIIDKRNLAFLVRNKKSGREIVLLRFIPVAGKYYFIHYDKPGVPIAVDDYELPVDAAKAKESVRALSQKTGQ